MDKTILNRKNSGTLLKSKIKRKYEVSEGVFCHSFFLNGCYAWSLSSNEPKVPVSPLTGMPLKESCVAPSQDISHKFFVCCQCKIVL